MLNVDKKMETFSKKLKLFIKSPFSGQFQALFVAGRTKFFNKKEPSDTKLPGFTQKKRYRQDSRINKIFVLFHNILFLSGLSVLRGKYMNGE